MGQIWDRFQPALDVADAAWDALRVLVLYIAPVAYATFELVGVFARSGHLVAAWLTIGVVFLAGVAIARTAGPTLASGRRRRSPIVRRINRRAAIILPIAGVGLATLLAAIAVKPVLLGLLGVAVLLFVVPGLGALGGHELLHVLRRRRTESGQPFATE